MHVAFVCIPCKSHTGVHLGPLQTNKSLPSDKLIKVPSCCCAWLTGDRASSGWDSFPGCIVYPPSLSQCRRPDVADWVCFLLSDVVPFSAWYFITRSDGLYTAMLLAFLPKQFREWILTSVTLCNMQWCEKVMATLQYDFFYFGCLSSRIASDRHTNSDIK